jgi:hypothetical protein
VIAGDPSGRATARQANPGIADLPILFFRREDDILSP